MFAEPKRFFMNGTMFSLWILEMVKKNCILVVALKDHNIICREGKQFKDAGVTILIMHSYIGKRCQS